MASQGFENKKQNKGGWQWMGGLFVSFDQEVFNSPQTPSHRLRIARIAVQAGGDRWSDAAG